MASAAQHSSPVSLHTLRRQVSAVGAACGNAARADLSGGRWVTGVPTATGLKPTARLRTKRGCPDQKDSKEAQEKTLTSEWRSLLIKCLTEPTWLSRWEKRGRGGTEVETVKPLDGVQRVQVPHG